MLRVQCLVQKQHLCRSASFNNNTNFGITKHIGYAYERLKFFSEPYKVT